MSVPQTVTFILRVHYMHANRPSHLPTVIETPFETFEGWHVHYYKERKRRAYADRATSAEYRMVLTDHGREVCDNDADRAWAHRDVINGKWFKV